MKIKNTTKYYNGGDLTFGKMNFNNSYERGLEGERYFLNMFEKEDDTRVEVKYEQYQWLKTGNLYCEFEQITKSGRVVPSGFKKDYDVMAYGIKHPLSNSIIFIVASKEDWEQHLRWLYTQNKGVITEKKEFDGTNHTKGYLLPLKDLFWNEDYAKQYEELLEKQNKERLKELKNEKE